MAVEGSETAESLRIELEDKLGITLPPPEGRTIEELECGHATCCHATNKEKRLELINALKQLPGYTRLYLEKKIDLAAFKNLRGGYTQGQWSYLNLYLRVHVLKDQFVGWELVESRMGQVFTEQENEEMERELCEALEMATKNPYFATEEAEQRALESQELLKQKQLASSQQAQESAPMTAQGKEPETKDDILKREMAKTRQRQNNARDAWQEIAGIQHDMKNFNNRYRSTR